MEVKKGTPKEVRGGCCVGPISEQRYGGRGARLSAGFREETYMYIGRVEKE